MRKITAFILFIIFSIGLIGCSSQESYETKEAPSAVESNSNSMQNAPGTTPPADVKGKSDADRSDDGKSDADK